MSLVFCGLGTKLTFETCVLVNKQNDNEHCIIAGIMVWLNVYEKGTQSIWLVKHVWCTHSHVWMVWSVNREKPKAYAPNRSKMKQVLYGQGVDLSIMELMRVGEDERRAGRMYRRGDGEGITVCYILIQQRRRREFDLRPILPVIFFLSVHQHV